MQNPPLYLTTTCKVRLGPRHSSSAAAPRGMAALPPQTGQHLCREQVQLPPAAPQQPWAAPRPSSVPVWVPQQYPRATFTTHLFLSLLQVSLLNPDAEFIWMAEGHSALAPRAGRRHGPTLSLSAPGHAHPAVGQPAPPAVSSPTKSGAALPGRGARIPKGLGQEPRTLPSSDLGFRRGKTCKEATASLHGPSTKFTDLG